MALTRSSAGQRVEPHPHVERVVLAEVAGLKRPSSHSSPPGRRSTSECERTSIGVRRAHPLRPSPANAAVADVLAGEPSLEHRDVESPRQRPLEDCPPRRSRPSALGVPERAAQRGRRSSVWARSRLSASTARSVRSSALDPALERGLRFRGRAGPPSSRSGRRPGRSSRSGRRAACARRHRAARVSGMRPERSRRPLGPATRPPRPWRRSRLRRHPSRRSSATSPSPSAPSKRPRDADASGRGRHIDVERPRSRPGSRRRDRAAAGRSCRRRRARPRSARRPPRQEHARACRPSAPRSAGATRPRPGLPRSARPPRARGRSG